MRLCIKYECLDPVAGNPNDARNREVYCEYHRLLYSVIPDPGPSSSALNDQKMAAAEFVQKANGY